MNTALPSSLLLFLGLSLTCRVGGEETHRIYLSGRDKDTAVPWRFMCTSGAQSGYWTNLAVPSHWDMHGFGTLTYKKDATNAWDERGLYQLDFEAPRRKSENRAFLVFEGVMTDTTAKLNGIILGPTHQGGFYRFKYDVTDALKWGRGNTLDVEVARHSANESVNKAERLADYWVFAGIYRPVYLEIVPEEFIERVAIEAKANGSFAMDVFTAGPGQADTVEAQFYNLDGTLLEAPFSSRKSRVPMLDNRPFGAGFFGDQRPFTSQTKLRTKVADPAQWTAETPNLYSVEVRLKRGDQVVHTYKQRFGFRTLEVREGDGIYVNGQKVILKGVNRHSSWPDSGRCLSEAVHRLDIDTMKEMNMNAVRMSHYPPDVEFLDLCDELGLYVLDELAGWHNHYDDKVGRQLVEAMVTRDVNHPSILFWDNGNEGGFNTNLDSVYGKFDLQKRPVLHPWAPFSGINTAHYLAYETAQIAASGEPMYYQPKPNDEVINTNLPNAWIYMPTEFLHGLYDGGAGAGMEDYWTMMMSHSNCAGGFIWVFADEGIKRPDTGEIDTAGNQAPDGIVGPYRQREGSFYTIKQLWSPIQISRLRDGTLEVENHYSFLNADECQFSWELRQFPGPFDSGSGYVVLDSGLLEVPSIKPGSAEQVAFEMPVTLDPPDALAVSVKDPSGRELWTWVWPLGEQGPSNFLNGTPPGARQTKAIVMESEDAITVAAGKRIYEFSRQTGMLVNVHLEALSFPLRGPVAAVGESTLKSINHEASGNEVAITADYDGALRQVTWKVKAVGWLECRYEYEADGLQEYCGVIFNYPEAAVKSKRWLGNGPYRVWKNRLPGNQLSVWQNEYNNCITGYAGWDYPEFKGCFSGVRWLQLTTEQGVITVVPSEPDAFVQVLTPDQPPENLRGKTSVSLPECGLAILDAIPPIGSKFKAAETTGPQGQLSDTTGQHTGSLDLFFGK